LLQFRRPSFPPTRTHNRRDRTFAAVEAGGKQRSDFDGKVRVLFAGPQNFERFVIFPPNEEPATITEIVRMTVDD
jgi:hypothetical protein